MPRKSCLLVLWAGLVAAGSAGGQERSIQLGKHRQLFVDDYVIAQMVGVRRVLNRPRKHPANPVVVADRPWEGLCVYIRGTVLHSREERVFRMWYSGIAPGKRAWCYATSRDGVHWQKPELGLVEFGGSKANNLLGWDSPRTVMHTPNDSDPARRYKALLGKRGAFSPEGLRWRYGGSQSMKGNIASDNVTMACHDASHGRYIGFAKVNVTSGKHMRRSVAVGLSSDFLTWSPAKIALVPDARDDELARQRMPALRSHVCYDDGPAWYLSQFYLMAGFPYEGMYLGMLEVFDISGWPPGKPRRPGAGGEDGIAQVQLTSSRDLLRWDRVCDRDVFISVGEAGTWEAGWIGTVSRPIVVEDEIWIYYGGLQTSHAGPWLSADAPGHKEVAADYARKARERGKRHGAGGIGLATLRLDGWVSIDAGDEAGQLTTKLLVLERGTRRLLINAKARKGGVAVEILDADGRPCDGYSKDECRVFVGDAIRHTVRWRGGCDLSRLAGTTIRLRFHLRNAKLYSFVFAA